MLEYCRGLLAHVVLLLYAQKSNILLLLNYLDRLFPKLSRSKSSKLPTVCAVEKLSENCYRVLGLNPGPHTLQGTNTYLVGSGAAILVDTGEAGVSCQQYIDLLFDCVFPAAGTTRLSHILLTHGHLDHIGGVSPILDELTKRKMFPLPIIHKVFQPPDFPIVKWPSNSVRASVVCNAHIVDGAVFATEDGKAHLRAVHTPGHTGDHCSFQLLEDGALLTGDCILGCGTSVFDDLAGYVKSLHLLRDLIVTSNSSNSSSSSSSSSNSSSSSSSSSNKISSKSKNINNKNGNGSNSSNYPPIRDIYPGHGPVVRYNALEKVCEYIRHRETREKQVEASLEAAKKHWISAWSLVTLVYGPLSPTIFLSALWNLDHHLQKLKLEGRVQYRFPQLWRIGSLNNEESR